MQFDKQRLFFLVLFGVVAAAILVGGWSFLSSSRRYDEQLNDLEKKIRITKKEAVKIAKLHRQMKQYRLHSLPGDTFLAGREYRHYLRGLMEECDFENIQVPNPLISDKAYPKAASPRTSSKAKKKAEPIYTALAFPRVRGEVSLAGLTSFLKRFEMTPLLHQIKTLTVEPADESSKGRSKRLTVTMSIEALIIEKADRPETLVSIDERLVPFEVFCGMQQGPVGLALVPWAIGPSGPFAQKKMADLRAHRKYAAIPQKDIFVGYIPPPPPPRPPIVQTEPEPEPEEEDDLDVKEFVRLMMITVTEERAEAKLRNRLDSREIRLRTSPGFNFFRISNISGTRTLLKAQVVHIDYRNVYFVWENKLYRFHIGDTLARAIQEPIFLDLPR